MAQGNFGFIFPLNYYKIENSITGEIFSEGRKGYILKPHERLRVKIMDEDARQVAEYEYNPNFSLEPSTTIIAEIESKLYEIVEQRTKSTIGFQNEVDMVKFMEKIRTFRLVQR